MNTTIFKNKRVMILIVLLIVVLTNLFYEFLFVIRVDRFRNQIAVDKYVKEINKEYEDKVCIFQLGPDSITFRVTPNATSSDLYDIVEKFEEWIKTDDKINFIDEIHFVGLDAHDTLRPYSSDLDVSFLKEDSEHVFETMDITAIDSSVYPFIEEGV